VILSFVLFFFCANPYGFTNPPSTGQAGRASPGASSNNPGPRKKQEKKGNARKNPPMPAGLRKRRRGTISPPITFRFFCGLFKPRASTLARGLHCREWSAKRSSSRLRPGEKKKTVPVEGLWCTFVALPPGLLSVRFQNEFRVFLCRKCAIRGCSGWWWLFNRFGGGQRPGYTLNPGHD